MLAVPLDRAQSARGKCPERGAVGVAESIVTVSGYVVVGQGREVNDRIDRLGWGAIYTFPIGWGLPGQAPKQTRSWFHFPVALAPARLPQLESVRLCFKTKGAAVVEVNLWDGERPLAIKPLALPASGDHCGDDGGLSIEPVGGPDIRKALGISVLAKGGALDWIHFVSVRVALTY